MTPIISVLKVVLLNSFLAPVYFVFGLYLYASLLFGIGKGGTTIVSEDIGLFIYTLPWSLFRDGKGLDWQQYLFYFIFLVLNTVILYFIGFFLTKWLGALWQGVISAVLVLIILIAFFSNF